MPIFEYHCMNCGRDFEMLVLGNQEVLCPACKESNVNKLLSACSHKSEGKVSSSSSSSCASCSATSCKTCGSG